MATVELDSVDGALLIKSGNLIRYRRPGWVDAPELVEAPYSEVLLRVAALSGVPQQGNSLSDDYPDVTVRSVQISTNPRGKAGRRPIIIEYSNDFGNLLTTFMIRNRGYLGSFETDFLPGDRAAFTTSWQNADGTQKVKEDHITMNIARPMREISIAAVVFGDPDNDPQAELQDAVGHVNLFGWQNKPTGYWLITGAQTDYSVKEGYYSYSVTALTKVTEDWALFGILKNHLTGSYVAVSDAAKTALTSKTYQYGCWGYDVTTNSVVSEIAANAGILRVDAYPEADFEQLFGFI